MLGRFPLYFIQIAHMFANLNYSVLTLKFCKTLRTFWHMTKVTYKDY